MATQHILIAIDGTGSKDWKRNPDGLNSHVYRFYRDFIVPGNYKKYIEGPGNFGTDMSSIIKDGLDSCLQMVDSIYRINKSESSHSNDSDIKVCLIGHSRGAVAALEIGTQLYRQSGINTYFLGLYDAVDKSWVSGYDAEFRGTTFKYHAMRAYSNWSGTRSTFGNVDKISNKKLFNTSHGGIGGDPGFFVDLIPMINDSYCNALELLHEINQIKDKEAFRKRCLEIDWFWRQSTSADEYIRKGAGEAHLPLFCSNDHKPYKEDYKGERLKAILAEYGLNPGK